MRQVVVFRLCEEEYGIDIGAVREIITVPGITRVPHAPEYVRGIINLRGGVIPVIDLAQRLGLTAERQGERIIVVEREGVQLGLLVDTVSEVTQIAEDSVEGPAGVLDGQRDGFVEGVAKLGERLVLLLDVGRCFEHGPARPLVG